MRAISPRPGSQRLENGIQLLDDFLRAADHHAVAAVESPDPAAGADIHVVNTFLLELVGAANVIFEIGVAAVDEDVAGLHALGEGIDGLLGRVAGWDHQPRDCGACPVCRQSHRAKRSDCAFAGDFLYVVGAQIGDHHFVAAAHQAACHVGAHLAQTDHSQIAYSLLIQY